MHNARTDGKKSVSVRLPTKSWKDLGDMAQKQKRPKTKEFEVIMDAEKLRRKHIGKGAENQK